MKIVAFILVLGVLFLGPSNFPEGIPSMLQEKPQCQMDCCPDHDRDCADSCNDEATSTTDQHCPPGCDFSCNFYHNIVIVVTEFLSLSDFELIPRVANFDTFFNRYQFEFFNPHFQPPRFS